MALSNRFNQRLSVRNKLNIQDRDRDSELVKLKSRIRRYADAFHNSEAIVSDEVYDRYIDKLKALAPDDPLLKKVGAPVRGAKVSLPYTMPSLDKYRSHDFDEIRSRKRGNYFYVSDKIDGTSALINHEGRNKSIKMYSRGNGLKGQDITQLLTVVEGIGEIRPGEAVRGELAMSRIKFKKSFANKFENSRNLVSGVVNSNDRASHKAAKHIVFIAHEFVNPAANAEIGFARLKERDFTIPEVKKFSMKTSVAELDAYVKQRKAASKIDLDGIVIEFSDGYRCSYKLDDPSKSAVVKEVKWSITKGGLLKPVVWFETGIRIAGTTVVKATGYNAKFIMDNGIGVGAKVEVIKAGDIIPKIIGVVKEAKPEFPKNGVWDANKVEAILDIRDKKAIKEDVKKQKAITLGEAFKILGIPNFRAQMAIKLVSAKMYDLKDVILSDASDFKRAGLGDRQSQQLFTEMNEALRRVDHARMMWASGAFPRGYALSKFSTILEHFSYATLKKMSASRMIEAIGTLPSMSQDSAIIIQKNFDKYVEFIDEIGWKPTARTKTGAKESHSYALQGKSFVFTKFRDAGIQTQIENQGGKISNSVTKNTTAVVVLDVRSTSTKVTKAKALGVPVISVNQLRTMYLS